MLALAVALGAVAGRTMWSAGGAVADIIEEGRDRPTAPVVSKAGTFDDERVDIGAATGADVARQARGTHT